MRLELPSRIRILGVMTGTSCDGIDVACLEWPSGKPLWFASHAFDARLRERIFRVQRPGVKVTLKEWLELERDFTDWTAERIERFLAKRKPTERPHALAIHGQTVAHFPKDGVTLQILDPARITARIGLSVISHFRNGDIAAGGEGAPLVPIFQRRLAEAAGRELCLHNLGGISNLAVIPKQAVKPILAFDTGPANAWIDEAVTLATRGARAYDRGGLLARAGHPDREAVGRLLRTHPFFKLKPPKSTGRDDFPFQQLRQATRARGANLVATATLLTAVSIGQAYARWVCPKHAALKEVYFCGGGALNPTLLEWIQAELPGKLRARTSAELPKLALAPQAMEASAFSYLGYLSLTNRPLGGTWTGVDPRACASPGWITLGRAT